MNNGYGQPQQQYQQYPPGGFPPPQQQMWQPDMQQQPYQNQMQHQPQMPPQMMYPPQQQNYQGQQQYQRPNPLPPPMGRGGMPGFPGGPHGMPGMMPGPAMGMPRPGFPGMPMPNFNPEPPPTPEEDDRDPRLDDPWLLDFIRRNEKAPSEDLEWTAPKIKAHLREVSDVLQRLKELQLQLKTDDNPALVEQAQVEMAILDKLFAKLNPADPAFEKIKKRLKKNKKHQAWLRKARARVKVEKKNKVQKTAIMNRLIDEWQSNLINKDVARRKTEEVRKQRKLAEKQRQYEKKEATHLHDVLLKLEELRALRAQTLELEGQQVSSTPLDVVLDKYVMDNPITEEKKTEEEDKMEDEEKKEDREGDEEDGEEAEREREKEKEKERERERQREREGEAKPITEEDVKKYYDQAYESVDRLIAVRRAWDQFIVPTGFGTRIAPNFIEAPPPSRGWRKYLRKKKAKKVTPAPAPAPVDADSTMAESL